MSTQVQLRRGTAAQHNSFVGAPGEITVDTTNNNLRVHDGVTPGGHPLTLQSLFNAHLAENVSDDEGAHGLRIYGGNWTPEIKFNGNSDGVVYSRQHGRYKRIGDRVFVEMDLIISSKGTSTGNLSIVGLPFASSSAGIVKAFVLGEVQNITFPENAVNLVAVLGTNTNILFIRFSRNNTTTLDVSDTHLSANIILRLTFNYDI